MDGGQRGAASPPTGRSRFNEGERSWTSRDARAIGDDSRQRAAAQSGARPTPGSEQRPDPTRRGTDQGDRLDRSTRGVSDGGRQKQTAAVADQHEEIIGRRGSAVDQNKHELRVRERKKKPRL
jgi:hypothetical protein